MDGPEPGAGWLAPTILHTLPSLRKGEHGTKRAQEGTDSKLEVKLSTEERELPHATSPRVVPGREVRRDRRVNRPDPLSALR